MPYLEDLYSLQGKVALVTGATRGLGPVRPNLLKLEERNSVCRIALSTSTTTFEGQTIGSGGPGPIFSRLLEAWKQSVGIDFVAQACDYSERLPSWEQQQESTTSSR